MVYGIILHYEVGLKQGNKIYSQRYKDGQILNSKWSEPLSIPYMDHVIIFKITEYTPTLPLCDNEAPAI